MSSANSEDEGGSRWGIGLSAVLLTGAYLAFCGWVLPSPVGVPEARAAFEERRSALRAMARPVSSAHSPEALSLFVSLGEQLESAIEATGFDSAVDQVFLDLQMGGPLGDVSDEQLEAVLSNAALQEILTSWSRKPDSEWAGLFRPHTIIAVVKLVGLHLMDADRRGDAPKIALWSGRLLELAEISASSPEVYGWNVGAVTVETLLAVLSVESIGKLTASDRQGFHQRAARLQAAFPSEREALVAFLLDVNRTSEEEALELESDRERGAYLGEARAVWTLDDRLLGVLQMNMGDREKVARTALAREYDRVRDTSSFPLVFRPNHSGYLAETATRIEELVQRFR